MHTSFCEGTDERFSLCGFPGNERKRPVPLSICVTDTPLQNGQLDCRVNNCFAAIYAIGGVLSDIEVGGCLLRLQTSSWKTFHQQSEFVGGVRGPHQNRVLASADRTNRNHVECEVLTVENRVL